MVLLQLSRQGVVGGVDAPCYAIQQIEVTMEWYVKPEEYYYSKLLTSYDFICERYGKRRSTETKLCTLNDQTVITNEPVLRGEVYIGRDECEQDCLNRVGEMQNIPRIAGIINNTLVCDGTVRYFRLGNVPQDSVQSAQVTYSCAETAALFCDTLPAPLPQPIYANFEIPQVANQAHSSCHHRHLASLRVLLTTVLSIITARRTMDEQ